MYKNSTYFSLIFTIIFLLLAYLLLNAEKLVISDQRILCNYYGGSNREKIVTTDFSNASEAEKLIAAIIEIVGLKPNFKTLPANVDNASAVIYHNKRYILFNPDFIGRLDRVAGNHWAGISILAHEIGHHLNGHTLLASGSRPPIELEADEFSGFVLRKMGASLNESQLAMKIAANERASHSHPARSERLKAIAAGWRKADDQMAGKTTTGLDRMTKPDTKRSAQPERAEVLDEKYISYEVNFNFDPEGKYFVTIRNNLVKVDERQLYMIGKFAKSNSGKFPYVLYQSDENYLFVKSNGIIVTPKGRQAGYMKRFNA